jgi:lactoylglutathione lyase
MFEKNMLTFNPGWDQECKTVDGFDDVRAIYKKLKDRGENISAVTLDSESGPGSFIVTDPDGNPVLIDQHV